MAVTQNLLNGDGTAGPFQFTFELLGTFSAVQVQVVNPADGVFTTQIEGTDYTLTRSTKQILFLAGSFPAVDVGNILIKRFTTRTRQIDYVSGTTLSERNLDNDTNRLTMVDQEIENNVVDALTRNDARTAWDGEGLPSEDCLPAVSVTGWVTLGQLNALLADVQIAELNDPTVLTLTANGVSTEFLLSGAVGLGTGQPTIWINAVIQRSDSGDYEILNAEDSTYPSWADTNDILSFTTAPPDGAIIHIRIFTGTVLGVLPDAFINDPDQLADNVIQSRHINIGTGSAGRAMIFDALGDPATPVPGLQHLINSSQSLPADALTALVNVTTGLSLDLFARLVGGAVPMNLQKITLLGEPDDPSDAATKAYVDGVTFQVARGEVLEDDFPTALGEEVVIVPGFAPDFFVVMAHQTEHQPRPNWGVCLWLRGGLTDAKQTWGGRFNDAGALRDMFVNFSFEIRTAGATMVLKNTFDTAAMGGDGNPTMTDLIWFAIKI